MTATTNTIVLRTEDGEEVYRDGVFYAEEAVHADTGEVGIIIQYASQVDAPKADQRRQHEPSTEFVAGADLVCIYDEIAEEPATDEYKRHVEH